VVVAGLAGSALALHSCGGDTTRRDLREIENAYYSLRDAILQGDDEAFFRLHCREAREGAVANFPALRAEVLSLPPDRRAAFCAQYRVAEEEFLRGDPRALVVRMMPWKSGWRAGREAFRNARVRDVRIERVPIEGGGVERRGVVVLEPAPVPGAPPPEAVTVVFVRDEDGWRRKWFFTEWVPETPPRDAPR
jgi:hypothetical protein